MAWLLEDREYPLLLRPSPAAFADDRAWWGQSLAIAASQRGDVERVYVLTVSKAKAIETLEQLAATGHYLVYPGRLQLDPTFASLKGNPQFDKLLMRLRIQH